MKKWKTILKMNSIFALLPLFFGIESIAIISLETFHFDQEIQITLRCSCLEDTPFQYLDFLSNRWDEFNTLYSYCNEKKTVMGICRK